MFVPKHCQSVFQRMYMLRVEVVIVVYHFVVVIQGDTGKYCHSNTIELQFCELPQNHELAIWSELLCFDSN